MIMTNKLLPVALIAALVGGSVGALVMHSRNQSNTAAATTERAAVPSDATYVADRQVPADPFMPAEFDTAQEQGAYKVGFADGFRAAQAGAVGTVAPAAVTYAPPRTVYRSARSYAGRSYAHSTNGSGTYTQPRSRSFWQKHRDKLTVAIGAGSGAAIGGLIGGKKGAAIGALAGGGGSALYTYKLRNRSRRY
jgi:hypothetical protein